MQETDDILTLGQKEIDRRKKVSAGVKAYWASFTKEYRSEEMTRRAKKPRKKSHA